MIDGVSPGDWSTLLDRANAGELLLDPEVGNGLDKVCDDHIDRLRTIYNMVDPIRQVTGFGTFDSGRILENKFSGTASGTDRSLDTVLEQHIDAVTTAKEVVAKAIANFVAQDQDRASQFDQVAPQ